MPYVLMHMRGDPTTMQAPSNLQYDCVWRDVGHALQARADEAMACGIAAWNLVLDPGAGTDANGCLVNREGRCNAGTNHIYAQKSSSW